MASAHDATLAPVALAGLIDKPNVVAMPAASSVEQLERNVAAADVKRPEDEVAELSVESDRSSGSAVPSSVWPCRSRRSAAV